MWTESVSLELDTVFKLLFIIFGTFKKLFLYNMGIKFKIKSIFLSLSNGCTMEWLIIVMLILIGAVLILMEFLVFPGVNVAGIFDSGLIAYDKGYIYTNLESLQTIKELPYNVYDGIHIYSDDARKDILALQKHYPQIHFVGWWEQNGNFFAALALEKRALFIVLMLIILVASLNIISSLLMTVMSRRKEIALLLTMGVSATEIKKTFLYLGNFIGISGILVGGILAAIILILLSSFPIISLPADVYGSDKLPLELSLMDLGLILIGSFGIVFSSSYYPAKKATQIDPLQVLRNE